MNFGKLEMRQINCFGLKGVVSLEMVLVRGETFGYLPDSLPCLLISSCKCLERDIVIIFLWSRGVKCMKVHVVRNKTGKEDSGEVVKDPCSANWVCTIYFFGFWATPSVLRTYFWLHSWVFLAGAEEIKSKYVVLGFGPRSMQGKCCTHYIIALTSRLFYFCWWRELEPHWVVLRGCSWLCAQEWSLMVLRKELGLVTCKASTLSLVLSSAWTSLQGIICVGDPTQSLICSITELQIAPPMCIF